MGSGDSNCNMDRTELASIAVAAYLLGGGLLSTLVTLQYGLMVQSGMWSLHGIVTSAVVVWILDSKNT